MLLASRARLPRSCSSIVFHKLIVDPLVLSFDYFSLTRLSLPAFILSKEIKLRAASLHPHEIRSVVDTVGVWPCSAPGCGCFVPLKCCHSHIALLDKFDFPPYILLCLFLYFFVDGISPYFSVILLTFNVYYLVLNLSLPLAWFLLLFHLPSFI